MRDEFIRKIRNIKNDPNLSLEIFRQDKIVYSIDGRGTREFELRDGEWHFLSNAKSFFTSDEDSFPIESEDDIKLELFAHSSLEFLESKGVKKVVRPDQSYSQEKIGRKLGPTSPSFLDEYDNITFSQNQVWFVLGLQKGDKMEMIDVDSGDLYKVITGGFPLHYLTGLAEDPHQLDWDRVPEETFTLYLNEFALEDEKEPLLLAYL